MIIPTLAVAGQSYKIMVEKAQLPTLVVETKNKWFINLNHVLFYSTVRN